MFGNMGKMMKQVKQMQEDMKKAQDELAKTVVVGTSGGEMVKVSMSGTKEVVKVEINPDAVDKDDVELLQDLVLAATNDALKKVDEITEEKMGKMTGGLDFPGLF